VSARADRVAAQRVPALSMAVAAAGTKELMYSRVRAQCEP
jgi:hypothetical protein